MDAQTATQSTQVGYVTGGSCTIM
uniref:Pheromone n=2 Tax=Sporothrix TaxID=29907 RepID=A0A076KZS8_SPOSC|nr:pheromone precursor [Sporothrix schenckii]AIJ00885.1 pheromone precursor [Sporothrix brasiliensis]